MTLMVVIANFLHVATGTDNNFLLCLWGRVSKTHLAMVIPDKEMVSMKCR